MRKIVLFFIVLCSSASAGEHIFSLAGKATYTTSTRFLYQFDQAVPSVPDFSLPSNFGWGIDVRSRTLWGAVRFGVSYEHIAAQEEHTLLVKIDPFITARRTEGFSADLLEFSAYYIAPISSDNISFYMGGGFGYHRGTRRYSIASVSARMVNSPYNIGIHTATGIEWMFGQHLLLRTELRFRDPHLDAVTVFDERSVQTAGTTLLLNTAPTTTRINLSGINYSVGVAVVL